MDNNLQPDSDQEVGAINSGTVLLGRLMWMMIGPGLLVFAIYTIVTSGSGWLTAWDLVFAIVAALMVGGRWIEQRSGVAMTATGNRSTPEDFAKYVRILVPAAVGAWIAANVVGNHLLT